MWRGVEAQLQQRRAAAVPVWRDERALARGKRLESSSSEVHDDKTAAGMALARRQKMKRNADEPSPILGSFTDFMTEGMAHLQQAATAPAPAPTVK